MPGFSVRLPFAISLLMTLLLVVFASKSPTSTSHTASREAAISEQARAVVETPPPTGLSHANQLGANNADQLIEVASRRREPLMLLILGAALLSIAMGMKRLLWRKYGKGSGPKPGDE